MAIYHLIRYFHFAIFWNIGCSNSVYIKHVDDSFLHIFLWDKIELFENAYAKVSFLIFKNYKICTSCKSEKTHFYK